MRAKMESDVVPIGNGSRNECLIWEINDAQRSALERAGDVGRELSSANRFPQASFLRTRLIPETGEACQLRDGEPRNA
jgi:hypothetical protein